MRGWRRRASGALPRGISSQRPREAGSWKSRSRHAAPAVEVRSRHVNPPARPALGTMPQ